MDTPIPKKRFKTSYIIGTVGVLLIATLIYKNILSSKEGSKLNVQSDRLGIDTVKTRNFQEFITVTGYVLPIKTVIIGAIEGGRVEEKFVDDGTMVKQGQPILRLSNSDLQLSYLNQEANIVSQINQMRNTSLFREQQSLNLRETKLDIMYRYELARKRLDRSEGLLKSGVVSKVEVEELADELDNLKGRRALLSKTIDKDSLSSIIEKEQMDNTLDLMKRNLAISRQSLENLIVKAPIAGQLSGLNAELGELINEGSQIAQMDDLTAFKIRVKVDEFYISRIFNGQEGSFTFNNMDYKLKINKIYPQVTNGAFEADMVFIDKTPDLIKRGQSMTVKLELSANENAVVVKKGGFFQKTGGNWVYVVDTDGQTARKQTIRLGRQNPQYYEVLEGLKEGDIVITSSYDNYGDNDILILKN